ncbi:nudix hydrolase 18, mitochondrial-like [Ipomoea triloba]|uniref:nudix hydrolase 18, mitochondrial-like n=1 Tax=Ipomoea triloba TaxID=35885 RepID=UPI00125D1BE2|nr:nudix hydrolase 18, mitochondrial-like [Ipomoea triloba]
MQTDLKTTVASLNARAGLHMQRYDNGRRQVVGCVPYRYKDSDETSSLKAEDAFEVLVISPQRKRKVKLFPKGGWETDETMEAAGLRETMEEAGVVGEIEGKLGTWRFEKGKKPCEGHMFPLLVKEQLDSWPEEDIRNRQWMSVREARKVCKQWWMKEALEALVGHVTKQKNAGLLSAIGLSQPTLFS